jgi:hypothetical protein
MCVFVCVCEIERERERESTHARTHTHTYLLPTHLLPSGPEAGASEWQKKERLMSLAKQGVDCANSSTKDACAHIPAHISILCESVCACETRCRLCESLNEGCLRTRAQ